MAEGMIKEITTEGDSYRLKVMTSSMPAHFYWDGKSCKKEMAAIRAKKGASNIKIEYEVLGPLVTTTASPSKNIQRIKILKVLG